MNFVLEPVLHSSQIITIVSTIDYFYMTKGDTTKKKAKENHPEKVPSPIEQFHHNFWHLALLYNSRNIVFHLQFE